MTARFHVTILHTSEEADAGHYVDGYIDKNTGEGWVVGRGTSGDNGGNYLSDVFSNCGAIGGNSVSSLADVMVGSSERLQEFATEEGIALNSV